MVIVDTSGNILVKVLPPPLQLRPLLAVQEAVLRQDGQAQHGQDKLAVQRPQDVQAGGQEDELTGRVVNPGILFGSEFHF